MTTKPARGRASTQNRRRLNITALFAGIGGLEQGLHETGHLTSLFCESDPEACAILAARFPGTTIFPEVRRADELASAMLGSSNLITAGFPCTDFSQAGETRGFDGGRSSLIIDVIRLLRKRQRMGLPVEHVLIENVPNWRVLHGGAYFERVLRALEKLGYQWAYRVIDALAFGLPQRRNRVFVFATLAGDPRAVLFRGSAEPQAVAFGLRERAHGFYWTEGLRGLGWGEDCVPTLKGGSSVGIPSPPAILLPDGQIITPDIEDAERLQGFEAGWTDLDIVLDARGVRPFKQRKRWLLVGNAVNTRVSRWIGEQLSRPLSFDGEHGRALKKGEPLPPVAWSDGSARFEVRLSPWPVSAERERLDLFVRARKPLSAKATRGFYTRLMSSRLRGGGDEFRRAVATHLQRMERAERAALRPRARREVAYDETAPA